MRQRFNIGSIRDKVLTIKKKHSEVPGGGPESPQKLTLANSFLLNPSALFLELESSPKTEITPEAVPTSTTSITIQSIPDYCLAKLGTKVPKNGQNQIEVTKDDTTKCTRAVSVVTGTGFEGCPPCAINEMKSLFELYLIAIEAFQPCGRTETTAREPTERSPIKIGEAVVKTLRARETDTTPIQVSEATLVSNIPVTAFSEDPSIESGSIVKENFNGIIINCNTDLPKSTPSCLSEYDSYTSCCNFQGKIEQQFLTVYNHPKQERQRVRYRGMTKNKTGEFL
ncbi:uncharacterized protein KQ657_003454 [Scheffersomyces spartinae]|uniref:Uncharacterized protein n=1 Tax=Scheffersomyces spartinae TaxID=45513 RepID=A0A9P8AGH9_9ASCO|nr:uncharacterized protein KQ657_003454 [Scheffersomyces spartinae]KAG7191410.1 hypothetical protein KQ657_003454 [Scheffersomyces spartinae]